MKVTFLSRFVPCVALLGAMLMLVGVASAAHIPVTIDASSTGEFSSDAVYVIDGTGLDASNPPQHQGGGPFQDSFLAFNDFDGAMDLTFFLFNLNGTYDVDSFRFWNNNRTQVGRGYTQVNVAFSSTDNMLASFGAAQSFFPNIAPGVDGYEGDLFAITPALGAKYALLTFGDGSTLEFEGTFGGGTFAGFSEIQFYGAIPEPTTLSLLALSGLAMVGVRRRRAVA